MHNSPNVINLNSQTIQLTVFFLLYFAATVSQEHSHGEVEADCPKPAKRRALRSSFGHPTTQARTRHVLPDVCILCQKTKTIKCRSTQKRKKEPLTRCSTIEATNLQKAAQDNNNEALLLQIKDQDCVAIEVKYHNSCYRDYTRYLTKQPTTEKNDVSYSEAFEIFCETVKTRLIENKEIMRLKRLTEMFVKQVNATHGTDASSYKTGNLKSRLAKKFPQLCFITPHMRSQGDIVYVNDISTEVLVEEQKVLRESVLSTTHSEQDSTTEDEMHNEPVAVKKTSPDNLGLRNAYVTALELRNEINSVKSSAPWPPTAEHLNLQAAEAVVPWRLYNFLAWTIGASEEPDVEKFVRVGKDTTHRKLLSISQDIISLSSNGRKLMPKHMSLAMAVRHLSGSAQLIGLLIGFGHSVSHSVVLNHDTALAEQEMMKGDDAMPSTIQTGQPITIVWDNNDFGEETASGHGTTHNTNGIIIQEKTNHQSSSTTTTTTTVKRSRKRSMQPPAANLATYYGGKKEGPTPFGSGIAVEQSTYMPLLKYPKKLDQAYHVTKFNLEGTLPSWTGFNHLLSEVEVPPQSVIGYLPVIDGSPTEMNTVLTILQRSVQIADKLNLETVVLVMDQAIYCKAQIIRWRNAQFMKRLVIRLGAFHTAMSFLGCIGKRFRDAGLQDILIESEVVAAGSVNGVLNGKHYNRAVRAHKLMSDALHQLRLDAFMQSVTEEEAQKVKQLMADLQGAFPNPEYRNLLDSDRYAEFEESFHQFLEANKNRPTFQFWNSYLDMVEVLLLFLRGTREGNWDLHLASVRHMVPWIFAYDHINYSRYLPVYWLEMRDLPNTHPAVHQQCMDGQFTVQRSENAFAQVACDQTIEQTANRDSKTKGGMTGFTTSKGTVNRWIWSHHARGLITRQCENMAGKEERGAARTDLLQSRMKKDKTDVHKIVEAVNSMVNPYKYEEMDIVNITSGTVATEEVAYDLQSAYERGEAEFVSLCKERLQKGEVDLLSSMTKLKLKTFTNLSKSVTRKVRGKEVTLKADRNLLARLVVIGRFRKLDRQELLTYSLGPIPLALCTSQGCLVKTNKAKMLHSLESQPEKPIVEIPGGGVYVIDAMATIQKLDVKKLPGQRTFLDLANVLLKKIVNRAKSNGSSTIHFVADTYIDQSIKNAERTKRAASGSQVMRVYGQAVPKQWKKFLSCGVNKEALLQYLFDTWKTVKVSDLRGVTVFFAYGSKCHAFSSPSGSGPDQIVDVQEIVELNSTQEEADTRMYLHASYAAKTCTDVIIISPDTDVLVIGVSLQPLIDAQLYFHTGKGANLRTLDVKAIHESVGDEFSKALIGLHCFTGCDSVSAFYGRGKKKAFDLLLKDKTLCPAFQDLGERFDVQPDMEKELEKFVCKLYGQKDVAEVNIARYDMFRLARKAEIAMPPNHDALRQHIKRANYQAGMYFFLYSIVKKNVIMYTVWICKC